MKLESVNADPNMTSLQGYVECSYKELCEIFGLPFEFDDWDKVSTSWLLKIRDDEGISHVITIYDWKEAKPPRGKFKWHIGGHNKAAPRVLREYVERENVSMKFGPVYGSN